MRIRIQEAVEKYALNESPSEKEGKFSSLTEQGW